MTQTETARVYFPVWAKVKQVALTPESRAILRTLYREDDTWTCGQTSAVRELEPYILD